MRALDVPDLLAIAARVLDLDSQQIVEESDLELVAISASELGTMADAPELALPAYVLLYGLDTRRPFPRSNRRIAVAATIQFVTMNGGHLALEPVEELDAVMDLVRSESDKRLELLALLRQRIHPPKPEAPPSIDRRSSTMFERFTDRARRVVVLAQEEAVDLRHNYIGTEHILLGLIRVDDGIAARVLDSLGISSDAVRAIVEEVVGKGSKAPVGHIPFTPRAKRVMELSMKEAIQLGHNYIGTEHILLGLVREGEGVASQSLIKLGAELDRVRAQVVEQLSGYTVEEGPKTSDSRRAVLHAELDGLLEENARLRTENRRLRRRLARLASIENDPFDDLFGPDDWPDDLGGPARALG